VTVQSEALICGHSLPGIEVSNPVGKMDVRCECCGYAGRGLCVGRADHSSREVLLRVVSKCDRVASIMRRPWPTGGCRARRKSITEATEIYVE
jgi:hypothetical protein